MRRKLVPLTMAYAFGIAFMRYAFCWDIKWLLALLTVIFCFTLFCFKKRHIATRVVCLFLVIFLTGALHTYFYQKNLEALTKNFCQMSQYYGVIIKAEEIKTGGVSYVIKGEAGKLLVKIYEENSDFRCNLGKEILVEGKIEGASPARNPRCFDYAFHLKTKGIAAITTAKDGDYYIGKVEKPLLNFSGVIKDTFYKNVEAEIGSLRTGLLMGILFGEKNGIEQEIYYDFQKTSTAHILAVSGLHIGILYAIIQKFTSKSISLRKSFIKIMLLLFYGLLASFSPSVTRAIIMIGLHILSKPLRMRYDLLSAACLCSLMMLIYNPLNLFNVGFQLSFAAICTIAVVLKRINSSKGNLLISTACIQLGINPIVMYNFNYMSLFSIIVNPPVILLAGMIVPLGFAMIFTCYLTKIFGTGYVFQFMSFLMENLLDILIKANNFLGISGKGFFYCTSPKIWQLVLYYGLLFSVFSEAFAIMRLRRQFKKLLLLFIIIILLAFVFQGISSNAFDNAEIVFVDVGQGDCLHIRTESGKNILIDGGGGYGKDVGKDILLPYLLKNGVNKIDLAIISHLHLDHYGGITSLCEYIPVKKIAIYQGYQAMPDRVEEILGGDLKNVIYLSERQVIDIAENVKIEVLYPEIVDFRNKNIALDIKDENQMSLICRIVYNGLSVLMTADINQEGEADLIDALGSKLEATVLKVPHHGSKYSSSEAFIDIVNPKIAIIQVGKNNFGHPSQSTIEKYDKKDIMLYRNDINGAVCLYSIKNGQAKVKTMIN